MKMTKLEYIGHLYKFFANDFFTGNAKIGKDKFYLEVCRIVNKYYTKERSGLEISTKCVNACKKLHAKCIINPSIYRFDVETFYKYINYDSDTGFFNPVRSKSVTYALESLHDSFVIKLPDQLALDTMQILVSGEINIYETLSESISASSKKNYNKLITTSAFKKWTEGIHLKILTEMRTKISELYAKINSANKFINISEVRDQVHNILYKDYKHKKYRELVEGYNIYIV